MKRPKLAAVFKAVTVCGLILGFFTPVLYAASFLFCRTCPPGKAWLLALLSLAMGGAGYGMNFCLTLLEERKMLRTPVRKVLLTLIGVLLAVGCLSLFLETPLFAAITAVVLLVLYGFAAKLLYRGYERLFTESLLFSMVIENLVLLLVVYYIAHSYPIRLYDDLFIFTFLPVVFCFFVSRNQGNIDYLMERRRHDLAPLPKKIRRYNLLLLCGVFLVLLLLFVFRAQLTALLWSLVEGLKQLAAALVSFFIWLMTLLSGGSKQVSTPDELPDSAGPGELEAGVAIDWTVFAVLGIALLIVVYRRQLFHWLQEKIRQLKDLFYRLCFTSHTRIRAGEGGRYYTDVVESLTAEERVKSRKRASSRRSWKREYRRYQKLAGSERLRFGFRLWMGWLQQQGE